MEENKNICEYCGKNISLEKLKAHLKKQHLNKFENVIELTKYSIVKKDGFSYEKINEIINEFENSSAYNLEQKYNFRFRKYISDLGLNHRNISNGRKTKSCKDKQKETNLLKYGVENVSQSELIKEKKRNTFIAHYGVDNIWKLREYRLWWESEMIGKYGKVCLANLYDNQNYWGWNNLAPHEKEDRIKILNEDYKKWYYNLNDEERDNFIKNKIYNILKPKRSSLEMRVETILNSNVIYNKPQFWIDRKSYDFLLGDKIILEIQGTYWHCDPRFYKPDDIIKFGTEIYFVSEIWFRDRLKKESAENYNYKMYYLWEHDLNTMTDNDILDFVNQIISENKINKKN